MNLLTRREVASLIQQTPQFIGVHVKRGHLIEKHKRIDTDLKKNKLFLSKFITKEIERKEVEEKEEAPKTKKGISVGNIDYVIKQHDLKLKKLKIDKEKLDLSKKQAKLIEISEAKEIMNRSIIVLSNQYRQNSKQYILELASKYSIPDTDLAGIQKWFDDTINKSVNESNLLIKKECAIVADDYSERLNIGESKD